MSNNESFDLFDWINTGTNTRWEVHLYNDLALAGEMQSLEHDLAKAKAAEDGETLGESSGVARIEQQMRDVLKRWEESKSTWSGNGLVEETIDSISERHPMPNDIPPEPRRAQFTDEDDYRHAYEQWAKRRDKRLEEVVRVNSERNIEYVVAATTKIVTSRGTARGVTTEQVRALAAQPHGAAHLKTLIDAIEAATRGEVTVTLPKSLKVSESNRD